MCAACKKLLWSATVGLSVAVLFGCDPRAPTANPYLTSTAYRRQALLASLTNPSNLYSRVRIAHYGLSGAGGWEQLPEWNPRVEAVFPADLVTQRKVLSATAAQVMTQQTLRRGLGGRLGEDEMAALGERAFFLYPVRLVSTASSRLRDAADAERYGFWLDTSRGLGGLVRVELAGGDTGTAYTCATCHAAVRGGELVPGLDNHELDLGRLVSDGALGPAQTEPLRHWGPGRVDVTTMTGSEPVRIPDLRPTRWLTHLHQDATVEQRDRVALAIRIETLIITSHGESLRPPRLLTWALASYLWSLARSVEPRPAVTRAEQRGQALFAAECASCHRPPAFTGPPVPLDAVGTDPETGRSADRSTGTYRVPSLHGVSSRGALLHDGSVPDLATLFRPERTRADFEGGRRGPGPVRGHVFGLDLSSSERTDLLAFLGTL